MCTQASSDQTTSVSDYNNKCKTSFLKLNRVSYPEMLRHLKIMRHRLLVKNLHKWSNTASKNRLASTVAIPISDQKHDNNLQLVRSYEDIPGPKPLPLIGNIFRYFPYIGEFYNVPFTTQLCQLHQKHGDVVKLEGLIFRTPMIFLFKPDFCERMYRLEGPHPLRIAMEALYRYRKVNKHLFGSTGLMGQGEEWYNFRTKVNQHMMQPRTIKPHVSQIDEVTDDFIDRIREIRDPQTLELPHTFNNEMNKWSLESICAIALDHRMGSLKRNLHPQSEPQQMISAVHEMFDLMYELEVLPSPWKYYNTKKLKRFFKVLDLLYGTSVKYINKAKERMKVESNSQEDSMIQRLLKIDKQTAQIMAMDMLVAGVDTTGNSAGMTLYYVSKHPEVQEKLRAEIGQILVNKNTPVTYEALNQIPYAKACIKETLRLAPISIGNMRTMAKDVVIGGYRIPKGINVLATHSVISQDPNQFPHPEEFIPERWLRSNTGPLSSANAHPYAYLPFGFGPRTCIGRRFAELEITILLMKMIRNFELEWHHEPMQRKSLFINTMGSPLQLKVIDRLS